MYHRFDVVIGEPLPPRFGLVRYRTAAEYNEDEHRVGWPFMLAGTLIAGTGVAAVIVYVATLGSWWRR